MENKSPYYPTTEPIPQQGGGIIYTPAKPVIIPTQPGTSVHVFANPVRVGPEPCTVTCHVCGERGTSTVKKAPTMRTHLCALVLCLFICWPCAPCVYCVDSCLIKKHYCSKCNAYIGLYDPK